MFERIKLSQWQWWLVCLGLAGVLIVVDLDCVAGPYILFPITFVVPVGLATWYLGLWAGLGFAVGLTVVRLSVRFFFEGHAVIPPVYDAINAGIRMGVFMGMAVMLARLADQKRELARRVRILEGILPICSYCKKIRRSDGQWEQMEKYITEHSQAQLSHGMCQACGREQFPEYFKAEVTETK